MRGFLRGLKLGFGRFSEIIISPITFILLLFVYIFGIGLTSIIAKIFRKHFLDMKIKDKGSYWINREISKERIEDYYNQF